MGWLREWTDRLLGGVMRILGVPDVLPTEEARPTATDCAAPDAPPEGAPSTEQPTAPAAVDDDAGSALPSTEDQEPRPADQGRSSPPANDTPVILRVWVRS